MSTSSLRRQCQLHKRHPDIVMHDLRGNVCTQRAKIDRGDFDLVILVGGRLETIGSRGSNSLHY
ncbi:MAG: hypothetical protein ACR5K4_01690 [Sodalis sp. (in: enterobacteria)]